jgi:DNA (cytosine-5)-methyltransferase 1
MFSGIGGFDLAMRNLGHEIVGACEIDKYARQIYAKQFPGVPIHNDATALQGDTLPQFDVLCGGFPCQAFSIAGKRKGFSDTRGSLFFEIARIAKEKQPSLLFLENVKGLFNHDNGETFRTILSSLDEVGYDVEWQLHNSKYHVPQNRERVYIVGHLRGQRTRQVFPLGNIDSKSIKKIKQPVEQDTEFIPVVNDRNGLREVERATCLDANYFKGHDYHGARTLIYKLVRAVLTPDRAETRQVGRRIKEDGEPAFAVTTQDRHGVMIETAEPELKKLGQLTPHNGTSVYDISGISPTLISSEGSGSIVKIAEEPKKVNLIYFSNTNANMKQRMQEKEASWTLGTGTDFGIKEDKKIRKLTPVECERLQGFPDNWTEGISDTQRYKTCGNAVTVPVVQWIASHFNIGSTE